MKRVVIESPYAGDVAANVAFCRAVCRFAVFRGFSPYASHLIFTQVLDDDFPPERQLGIDAGLAWAADADEAWFCLRQHEEMTRGMRYALERHAAAGRTIRHLTFNVSGAAIERNCQHECVACGKPTAVIITNGEFAPCGPCVVSMVCP